jgi:hypothetical protein
MFLAHFEGVGFLFIGGEENNGGEVGISSYRQMENF